MKTIWKFPLLLEDEVSVMMPEGAIVLTAAAQRGSVFLWAVVDPKAPMRIRRFAVRGTGHPVGDDLVYHVGTVQLHDGDLVFSVFAR